MRIAICGRAGSGKSSLAQHLVDDYGFVKYSFAAKLKELAVELYDMEGKDRSLLQTFGHALRNIDDMVWINYLLNQIEQEGFDNVVIDDMRYGNEATFLKLNGFIIIKLFGRGYDMTEEQRNHPSEREIDFIEPHHYFDASGTLDECYKALDELMMEIAINSLRMDIDTYYKRATKLGNVNYRRGRDFEYRCMALLRKNGWHCMRKFASKNDKYKMPDGSILDVPLDVTAYKDGVYLLISMKYSINHATTYMDDPLWKNLVTYAKMFGPKAIPVLAGVATNRRPYFTDLRTLTVFDYLKMAKDQLKRDFSAKEKKGPNKTQMGKLLALGWKVAKVLEEQYDRSADDPKMQVRWVAELVKHVNVMNRLLKAAGDTAAEEDITTMLQKLNKQLEEAEKNGS